MIKIDESGKVECYTLILSRRDHSHIGQLLYFDELNVIENLNSADEISFTYYKYNKEDYDSSNEDIKKNLKILWDELTDFKFIYVKEIKEYFEISVEISDQDNLVKSVTGVGASEAELGQTNLYGLEINTESDILRDDYTVTKFYDKTNPKGSLLDRVLSVVPHYSVGEVDSTIANIQRSFSADDVDVYSFLTQTVAEEIGCLFTFDSVNRKVNAYDLKTNCINEIQETNKDGSTITKTCGYRGDFTECCPNCGCTDKSKFKILFGKDTSILVDSENLAESVTFSTDVDSVKNCFRLVAGDENMTAAIRNINPNASNRIYYFSEEAKHDMPEALVDKMERYDAMVEEYQGEYTKLVENLYNEIDQISYHKHEKMPSEEIVEEYPPKEEAKEGVFYLVKKNADNKNNFVYEQKAFINGEFVDLEDVTRYENTTSTLELNKILKKIPSNGKAFISIPNFSSKTAVSTVNTNIYHYLKEFYKSGYFYASVESGELTDKKTVNGIYKATWTGKIKMTNNSEPQDVVEKTVTFIVDSNYDTFIENKVKTRMKTLSNEEGSIFDVLNITIYKKDENNNEVVDYDATLEKFEYALQFYCQSRLESFLSAIQGCIDIMIEEKQLGSKDLYNTLYKSFYNKLLAVQNQLNVVSRTIEEHEKSYTLLNSRIKKIQSDLDFESYLGKELYKTFCAYKREQTYQNDNYISDGLTNKEIIENANAFLKAASNELYKSGEYQHSISGDLYNFYEMEEFAPLKDNFKLGNFIRVKIDGKLYKLRLIKIGLNFSDIKNIEIEFSDITKIKNGVSDLKSILDKATSMASSYGAVTKQVEKQSVASDTVASFVEDGLSLTNIKIVNDANNQSVTMDGSGISMKRKDSFTDTFEPNQMKIINNGIYLTSDNWETINTGIGKFIYVDPETGNEEERYGIIADTVQGNLILGNNLGLYSNDDSIYMKFTNNGLNLVSKQTPMGDGYKYSEIFEISRLGIGEKNPTPLIKIDSDGDIVINSNVVLNGNLNTLGDIGQTTQNTTFIDRYFPVPQNTVLDPKEKYYIWVEDD